MFDSDVALAGFDPPAIKIHGEVLTGRILSFPEALPLMERFREFGDANVPTERVIELAKDLCTAIGIPADKVLTLPPGLLFRAVRELFSAAIAMSQPSANAVAGSLSPGPSSN